MNFDNEIENSLKSGLETIIQVFNYQKEKYIQIIVSLNEKIMTLYKENETLKNENLKYLSQIEDLKSKINSIVNPPPKTNFDLDHLYFKGDTSLFRNNINTTKHTSTQMQSYLELIKNKKDSPSYNNVPINSKLKNVLTERPLTRDLFNSDYEGNAQNNINSNINTNNNISSININNINETNGNNYNNINTLNLDNDFKENRKVFNKLSNNSFHTSKTQSNLSKYSNIQKKINSLRAGSSSSKRKNYQNLSSYSPNPYNKYNNDTCSNYDLGDGESQINYKEYASNYIGNNTSKYKSFYNNDDNTSQITENKSTQYQKTSKFLKNCKLELSGSDYEELLKMFKENYGNENNKKEFKKKVIQFLEGNSKLQAIFENIYN